MRSLVGNAAFVATSVLDATDALCKQAGEFAEQYRLRGFDSIHLASFAEVARRAGPRETRSPASTTVSIRLRGTWPGGSGDIHERTVIPAT